MQLLAFGGCDDARAVAPAARRRRASKGSSTRTLTIRAGIAVLALSRTPEAFVERLRPALKAGACASLTLKPEYTMLGRTYALGYEPDLNETLIERPRRTVLNPAWPWAIWYPLRRSGRFAQLSEQEQRTILAEHGTDRHGVRRGRLRARRPARMPRPRPRRQRLRHRAHRQGPVPAFRRGPVDAQDPADRALPRPAGSLLRRPRHLAVRRT